MKSKRWFRVDRHRLTGKRQATCPHFKNRRLIVERVEDRLLLAGDFQSGMELQLLRAPDFQSNLIVIESGQIAGCYQFNSGDGQVFGTLDSSPSSGSQTVNIIISNATQGNSNGASSNLIFIRGNSADLQSSSIDHAVTQAYFDDASSFQRIGDRNLPFRNLSNPYIDVGENSDTSLYASDKPELPGERQALPLVESKAQPAIKSENALPRMGVDGARGRSQAFDLAMATGWESKSEFLHSAAQSYDARQVESNSIATQKPNALSHAITSESNSVAIRLANGSAFDPIRKSEASNSQSQDELPEATGQDGLAAHERLVAVRAVAFYRMNNDAASSTSSEAGQSDRALTGSEGDSQASSLQTADSTDQNRQAVFAELAKNAEERKLSPTYFDDNRRTNTLGLAVVAIAGQYLNQKWRQPLAASKTHLLPPRRRGLVK